MVSKLSRSRFLSRTNTKNIIVVSKSQSFLSVRQLEAFLKLIQIMSSISTLRSRAKLRARLRIVWSQTWQQERAPGLWQLTQLPIWCQTQQSNIKQAVRHSLLLDGATNLSASIIFQFRLWHDIHHTLTALNAESIQLHIYWQVFKIWVRVVKYMNKNTIF